MYTLEEQEFINLENDRPFHKLGKGAGMNNPFIEEVTASGEEILNIVEAIEPILSKVPRAQACMACLATAISMMNPNLSAQQMQEGVKGASEWICCYVTNIEMGSTPIRKMH